MINSIHKLIIKSSNRLYYDKMKLQIMQFYILNLGLDKQRMYQPAH